jgi:hypothetical protein
VHGKLINIEQIGLLSNFKPENVKYLKKILMLFDKLRICNVSVLIKKYAEINSKLGTQFVESFNQWRHRNCTIILNNSTNER